MDIMTTVVAIVICEIDFLPEILSRTMPVKMRNNVSNTNAMVSLQPFYFFSMVQKLARYEYI